MVTHMAGEHLNLFYSYHIEEPKLLGGDNLIRAFGQVLRALSRQTRGRFLHRFFDDRDALFAISVAFFGIAMPA
jgi:hypothetical protein